MAELVARRKFAVGTVISSTCSLVTEAVSLSDMDFVFIDCEHGPIGIASALAMVQSVREKCLSLIRTPDRSSTAVNQALDLGCDGIIVPQVNSAETARAVAAAAKYPPLGQRGVGLARAHGFGKTFADYLRQSNEQVTVFVQIEHIDAVRDVENICRVPGIEGIFIGPYDLSASLGKPGQVTDPEVERAVAHAIDVGKREGKLIGAFSADEAAASAFLSAGVHVVAIGTDLARLVADCDRTVGVLRAKRALCPADR
jgi:2-dehydro-3-deoxyglucarate aldolase/4-hydroxy-2-oxoheptanedioate aldolase